MLFSHGECHEQQQRIIQRHDREPDEGLRQTAIDRSEGVTGRRFRLGGAAGRDALAQWHEGLQDRERHRGEGHRMGSKEAREARPLTAGKSEP